MKYRGKVFNVKSPFDTINSDDFFYKAMKENCEFQYKNCSQYKKILDGLNFKIDDISSIDDIHKIPFIPTLFLKNHNIFSMPKYKTLISATSSGTKGKFSNIRFELSGLLCGLKMVLKIGFWRRLFSIIPSNYIVFGYKPQKNNKTAVTKTAFGVTLFSPAISRTYVLKYSKNGYYADFESTINAIKKYGSSIFPLNFIGFPSYTYFILKTMDEKNIKLNLRKGSKLMLGGGWKQFYKEKVDKEVLYKLAKKVLNIKEENIIEFFGAVEHPILYCDCKNHHFHIPTYSRVIIRDVKTFKPLKNGEVGLLNLLTPMVKATPILSVMTDDLAILHDGEKCGCGINSPYVEIVGRVGLKDIKTCAAGAAEFISEVKI